MEEQLGFISLEQNKASFLKCATIYDRYSFYHTLIIFIFVASEKRVNGTANETSSIAGRKTRPVRLLLIK